jgi:hypothetical protein
MVSQPDDYQSVLKTVSQWPAEQRATLAHALIESLSRQASGPRPKPTADEIVGSLRGDGPPTDEQVKQWIDEYRTRKYG